MKYTLIIAQGGVFVQEVKNFLSWYKHIDIRVECLKRTIDMYTELFENVKSDINSNIWLDKIVSGITESISETEALKKQIEDVIGAVSDEKLRTFLVLRYLECKPMERIAEEMYFCVYHVSRNIAPKALKAAAKIMREKKCQ